MVSTLLNLSRACTNLDILTAESSFRPRSDPCTHGDFFPEGVPGLLPCISTLISKVDHVASYVISGQRK